MTKKELKVIAECIRELNLVFKPEVVEMIVNTLANRLHATDARFDRRKFRREVLNRKENKCTQAK